MQVSVINFTNILMANVSAALSGRRILSLNKQTLLEFQGLVEKAVIDTFTKHGHTISNTTIRWVTNYIFARLNITSETDSVVLGEQIILNDYKVSELPQQDVTLLLQLFKNTIIEIELQKGLQETIGDGNEQTDSKTS